jgi:hypothetical protein
MAEHPKLLDALRLVASGAVTTWADDLLVIRLRGCGKLSGAIWEAERLRLVSISPPEVGTVPVALTDAGRKRLSDLGT